MQSDNAWQHQLVATWRNGRFQLEGDQSKETTDVEIAGNSDLPTDPEHISRKYESVRKKKKTCVSVNYLEHKSMSSNRPAPWDTFGLQKKSWQWLCKTGNAFVTTNLRVEKSLQNHIKLTKDGGASLSWISFEPACGWHLNIKATLSRSSGSTAHCAVRIAHWAHYALICSTSC